MGLQLHCRGGARALPPYKRKLHNCKVEACHARTTPTAQQKISVRTRLAGKPAIKKFAKAIISLIRKNRTHT